MAGVFEEQASDSTQVRDVFSRAYQIAMAEVANGKPVHLTLKHSTRTLEINACMWAMLKDVSDQVDWYGQKPTPEDWKNAFSAALWHERVMPGINKGTFVVLGRPTSKMSQSEMRDMITLIEAFGAEHGVKFKAPKSQYEGWLK